MTRIGPIGGTAQAPARARRAAGGFALPEAPPESGAAPASAVSSVGLLALQEGIEPPAARARRRAAQALAELRGFQLELLGGRPDPARAERLAKLAEAPEGLADPALAALLEEIAARARVEIARRRAPAPS